MKVSKWITRSLYVDTDTGEQLTEAQVMRDYKKIKCKKHVKIKETPEGTTGHIEYIWTCQNTNQLKLFDG